MPTSYHVTVDLRWAIALPDRRLAAMLKPVDDPTATVEDIRHTLIELLRSGKDFLPVCDRADERGKCQGHPVTDSPQT